MSEIVPQPCDGCTACCKIMGVREIEKLAGEWCRACDIGKGCKSYEIRPPSCQDFSCAYAQGLMGAELEARPDKSKVVFGFTQDGAYPVAYVDPQRSDAWKEGAADRWFSFMVRQLGKGVVVIGKRRIAVGNWAQEDVERIILTEGML